jgi:hypothetical protein
MNYDKDNVILVGNGMSIYDKKLGHKIDEFENVIRVNHYIKNVKNFSGSKTTQFYTTSINKQIFDFDNIFVIDYGDEIKYDNYTRINIEEINNLLKEFGFNVYPEKQYVSSDIIVLTHLLIEYDSITIYGLDYLDTKKYILEKEYIKKLISKGIVRILE